MSLGQTRQPQTIPDYVAPLIGWRAWYFTVPGNRIRAIRLHSTGIGDAEAWKPKVMSVARCLVGHPGDAERRHREALATDRKKKPTAAQLTVPVKPCHCGFYAFKTFEDMNRYQSYGPSQSQGLIYGPVALWGKVIRHDHGYRAQYTYPLAFFIDPQEMWTTRGKRFAAAVASNLATGYGVTTTLMEVDRKLDAVRRFRHSPSSAWLETMNGRVYSRNGLITSRWPRRLVELMETRLITPYTARTAQGDLLRELLSPPLT